MNAATAAMPAGAWRRYAAWSLDFALLGCIATTLSWPRLFAGWRITTDACGRLSNLLGRALADGLMQGTQPADFARGAMADPAVQRAAADVQHAVAQLLLAWLLCYALLAAPYHVGFERSRWQGSPGKHALRLVVVDARTGQPAALWRLVWRHAAGALSWLTLNLGHALAALPPGKRALHDLLSGTRVFALAGDRPLPAWTRAWLALQVLAPFVLLAWGLLRYFAALQAAIGG